MKRVPKQEIFSVVERYTDTRRPSHLQRPRPHAFFFGKPFPSSQVPYISTQHSPKPLNNVQDKKTQTKIGRSKTLQPSTRGTVHEVRYSSHPLEVKHCSSSQHPIDLNRRIVAECFRRLSPENAVYTASNGKSLMMRSIGYK